MSKYNISLIGFMGSGKTTIGKILADRIDYLFFDLDRIIELNEAKTIEQIFRSSGEPYFREIESKVIKKIYLNKKCIFACGGGVILREDNMRIIRANSKVIYLEISPIEAFNRMKKTTGRPLLDSSNRQKKIRDMIEERRPLYNKYSDVKITNGRNSKENTVNNILKKIADI